MLVNQFLVLCCYDVSHVRCQAIAKFGIIFLAAVVQRIAGWEMFLQVVEKHFTNVGGNLIVKWGFEPSNVPFTVAAKFRVRLMRVKRSTLYPLFEKAWL